MRKIAKFVPALVAITAVIGGTIAYGQVMENAGSKPDSTAISPVDQMITSAGDQATLADLPRNAGPQPDGEELLVPNNGLGVQSLQLVEADAAAEVPAAPAATSATAPSAPYSLLQMNLCLSGFAGCFPGTQYPNIVNEAINVISARQPNAVTLNEACSGDVAHIASETGYHMRFATVLISGQPLDCRTPGGRGVFGNAVMTKEAIVESADQAYTAQAGNEERRWICVSTARMVNICTTHLSTTGSAAARAANDGQCLELAAVLAARAEDSATIAGGDFNRLTSCAAAGMWTLTDADAEQLPGIQHAYGTSEDFLVPQTEIIPATFTDHDFLLVKTRLVPPARP